MVLIYRTIKIGEVVVSVDNGDDDTDDYNDDNSDGDLDAGGDDDDDGKGYHLHHKRRSRDQKLKDKVYSQPFMSFSSTCNFGNN